MVQNSKQKKVLPVISAPPSSFGGFHVNVQWSANTSLTLRSVGGVGLSAELHIDQFIEIGAG
jgi:hypothetical protein